MQTLLYVNGLDPAQQMRAQCWMHVVSHRPQALARRLDPDDAKRLDATTAFTFKQGTTTLQFLFGRTCVSLLNISANLRLAGPANSLQSLGQNRVAVVVSRVHPVSIHGGQVLNLELNKGGRKFGRVAELVGEGI